MARRRRGPVPKPRRRMAWLSTVAAYGIGVVFVGAGVLILLFGKEDPQAGEDAVKGSVTRLGVGIICLGVLALAIIGYLHWAKRKG